MDIDRIFDTMNCHGVRYLLIGGMNFTLRHEPVLTYDVDLWIEDIEENRRRCESALVELNVEWGPTEEVWGPVAELGAAWLDQQAMFCFTGPHGALDIFRAVAGLSSWQQCWERGVPEALSTGTSYRAISDEDLLQCQLALPEGERKMSRVHALQAAIKRKQSKPQ